MTDGICFSDYPGLLDDVPTDQFRSAFSALGNRLHSFETKVLSADASEYSARQMVFAGILGHAFECFHLLFLSWQSQNFAGVATSLRMLVEITSTNVYFLENPSRIDVAYEDRFPSAGKITAIGFRKHPDLKRHYQKYSNVVHPRKGSYRLQLITPSDAKHSVTGMFLEIGVFEKFEITKSVMYIFELVMSSFEDLTVNPSIFTSGEILLSGRAVKPNFSCIHWQPRQDV